MGRVSCGRVGGGESVEIQEGTEGEGLHDRSGSVALPRTWDVAVGWASLVAVLRPRRVLRAAVGRRRVVDMARNSAAAGTMFLSTLLGSGKCELSQLNEGLDDV